MSNESAQLGRGAQRQGRVRAEKYSRVSFWPQTCSSELMPLKFICRLDPESLPETTDPDLELNYVDIGNVALQEGIQAHERMRFADAPSRARKPVREGDIIVSTVRTYLKAIAGIDFDAKGWVVSTGFAVLRAMPGIQNRFLLRIVQSNPFVESVVSSSNGVSYPAINPSRLKNLLIPIPEFKIQKTITDILDRETTCIDELIEKKQRLVRLVDEKRSALITAAVTGVFNVKTKEIITCGRRSSSTASFPIKVLFDICRNSVEPSSFGDEDVFHYSLPNWHEIGDGRIEAANQIESLKLLISGGEILVSKLNPEKGAVVHARSHTLPVVASIEFIALRPRKIYGRYGYWLMLSAPIRAELSASVESVTNSHKRARVDRFLSLYVDVPDIPYQKAIADFLDRETARIEVLKAKTLDSINRLREYRSALITAAVTGQIDVATWRKQGQTDRNLDAIRTAYSAG